MLIEMDEDTLAHYGVKGMKWGVRKPTSSTGLSNRALNKQSKSKEKAEATARIMAARAKTSKQGKAPIIRSDKKTVAKYKEIKKTNYKQNKSELGSREAKKISRTLREEIDADRHG